MPSFRPSHPRRPVVAVLAVVLGLLALLLGPAAGVGAAPYVAADAPRLKLPEAAVFVLGQPGDAYVIEADGDPMPAMGVGPLPPGLRLVAHGDGSATLAGTPTGPAGTTIVEVRAQNVAGAVTGPLTVVVQQAPAFVDRGPAVFPVGRFSSVVVRTVGYPAPGIGLDGDLPAGLSYVDNADGTATISGTPVDGPDSAPVTLTAVNEVADASLTTAVQVVASADLIGEAGPTGPSAGPRREP